MSSLSLSPALSKKIAIGAIAVGGLAVAYYAYTRIFASKPLPKRKSTRRMKKQSTSKRVTADKAPKAPAPATSAPAASARDTVLTFLRRITGSAYDAVTQLQAQAMALRMQMVRSGQAVSSEQLQQLVMEQFVRILHSMEQQLMMELGLTKDQLREDMKACADDPEVKAQYQRFEKVAHGDTGDEEARLKALSAEQLGVDKAVTLEVLQESVDRSIQVKDQVMQSVCEEQSLTKQELQEKLSADEEFAQTFVSRLQSSIVDAQAAVLGKHDLTVAQFEEAVRAYSAQDREYRTRAADIRGRVAASIAED